MLDNNISFKIHNYFNGFLQFLKTKPQLKTKYGIFILILFLIPTQNNYTHLNIKAGEPVIRNLSQNFTSNIDIPIKQVLLSPPYLSATAIVVIDVPSKTVIYSKNPDLRLMPASITKLMTALVILDKYRLTDIVTVGSLYRIGQIIKLETGERLTIENLLYGLLVHSGNDAAYVLADNYPGGLDQFIVAMNAKAKALHLQNTTFRNPTGVEEYGHLTTAHDIAILASEAMNDEVIRKIVNTPSITIWDVDNKISHKLENVNTLVGKIEGIKGIKTGWTENAGECLAAYFEKDNRQIITVVLGSQDRFGETLKLINWVFSNFTWKPLPTNWK